MQAAVGGAVHYPSKGWRRFYGRTTAEASSVPLENRTSTARILLCGHDKVLKNPTRAARREY